MNNVKIKLFIYIVSFLIVFFITFPVHLKCDENCLKGSLLLSFMFAGFNISIYNFFIGHSFFFPIVKGAVVDSLDKDPSNKNIVIRRFGFMHSISWVVITLYGIYKLSWIFN